jgi:hypothetical protein
VPRGFIVMTFFPRVKTHRVHAEWQWPLSGVYSIMMEKSAQLVRIGGCTPIPFTISRTKVSVSAPAEKADTLPVFLLYPDMYSVTLLDAGVGGVGGNGDMARPQGVDGDRVHAEWQ